MHTLTATKQGTDRLTRHDGKYILRVTSQKSEDIMGEVHSYERYVSARLLDITSRKTVISRFLFVFLRVSLIHLPFVRCVDTVDTARRPPLEHSLLF
jgi:hypothetical protein